MKEKRQAKYLSTNKSTGNKKQTGLWIAVLILAVAVVAMGVALFLQRDEAPAAPEIPTESTAETFQTEEPLVLASIDTAYGPLQFAEKYLSNVHHEEVFEGEVAIEEFYMIREEEQWPLFSICFGDAGRGDCIGKITSDGQDVPVSVMIKNHTQENFPDSDTQQMYYVLMDQLDVVLDSIRADDSFAAAGVQTENNAEKQTAQLTYWTVELPESVIWEESTENNVYEADFFGMIGGETVHLYTISLGSTSADSILGVYETDSGKLPVGVKTYSLESQGTWSDDSLFQEYGFLMETINDVIQVITSDAKFSADKA